MEGFFKNLVSVFSLFCYHLMFSWNRFHLSLEKCSHFNSLYSRMLGAKFGWNWHGCHGEDNFLKNQQIFNISLPIVSPITIGQSIWNNLNLLYQRRQVWLKGNQWFWWRRFSTIVTVFIFFTVVLRIISRLRGAVVLYYALSPVWKGRIHSFKQTWISFT